jgi:hypothetical protein
MVLAKLREPLRGFLMCMLFGAIVSGRLGQLYRALGGGWDAVQVTEKVAGGS